jgi:hypothetical protein
LAGFAGKKYERKKPCKIGYVLSLHQVWLTTKFRNRLARKGTHSVQQVNGAVKQQTDLFTSQPLRNVGEQFLL